MFANWWIADFSCSMSIDRWDPRRKKFKIRITKRSIALPEWIKIPFLSNLLDLLCLWTRMTLCRDGALY